MKYDKNGLPIKEYYTEELQKTPEEKMKALKYQKYYTGGSVVLMFFEIVNLVKINKSNCDIIAFG